MGGGFTSVQTYALAGVAHLNPDGTADPLFNPGVIGVVNSLKKVGSILYIGGTFNAVGGLERTLRRKAAVDSTHSGVAVPQSKSRGRKSRN